MAENWVSSVAVDDSGEWMVCVLLLVTIINTVLLCHRFLVGQPHLHCTS